MSIVFREMREKGVFFNTIKPEKKLFIILLYVGIYPTPPPRGGWMWQKINF